MMRVSAIYDTRFRRHNIAENGKLCVNLPFLWIKPGFFEIQEEISTKYYVTVVFGHLGRQKAVIKPENEFAAKTNKDLHNGKYRGKMLIFG